jgi:hypothetical protein
MIIGFGSTEERFENNLEREFVNYVTEHYQQAGLDYFTDEFCESIQAWVTAKAKESQEIADPYKDSAVYPDRYTRYWVSTVSNASYIVFIISFHHINRRHAFSPDGWAMMQSERVFYVKSMDIKLIKCDTCGDHYEPGEVPFTCETGDGV